MDFITIDNQRIPYKVSLKAIRDFTKEKGKPIEDVFQGRDLDDIFLFCLHAFKAGCRIEQKECPFKTVEDIAEADEKYDFALNIIESYNEQEKKENPS